MHPMKMWRLFCLVLLMAGGLAEANAQVFVKSSQPQVFYNELKRRSEGVSTISADFSEVRYASYLKEPFKSSGQFYYQKRDKMRWEQKKPSSYIILIDGDRLRVSEDGKEKNVKSAGGVASTIREMLLMMVNGDFQNHKGFEKEVLENAGKYRVVLTPQEKRLKQRYDKMELEFVKGTLGLSQLTFFEKGGDRQVMIFTNEKLNGPLSPSVFGQF